MEKGKDINFLTGAICKIIFFLHKVFNKLSPVKTLFFYHLIGSLIPDGILKTKINNITFIFPGKKDKGLAIQALITKDYGADEWKVLESLLDEGMTYVDVGANFGYFAILAAKKVGATGKVYAFEPEPKNVVFLKRNIEAGNLKNVIIEETALCDKIGSAKFFTDEYNYGNYSLSEANMHKTETEIEVKTDTLNNYFKGKDKIDVLQLDTQGAEGLIFKSAEVIFEQDTIIVMEFWPFGLRNNKTNPTDLLQLFIDKGYKIFNISKTLEKIDDIKQFATQIETQKNGKGHTNLLIKKISTHS